MTGKEIQLYGTNLKGTELEERFFNQLKALLPKVGASNVTVISGLEKKEKKTTKFELDFLMIVEDRKIIIQIESKANLKTNQRIKVEEQFQNGLSFFKRMDHFLPGDGWRYLKVIYTEAISTDVDICDKCRPFVLDSNSDRINWWKFVLAGSSEGN